MILATIQEQQVLALLRTIKIIEQPYLLFLIVYRWLFAFIVAKLRLKFPRTVLPTLVSPVQKYLRAGLDWNQKREYGAKKTAPNEKNLYFIKKEINQFNNYRSLSTN